MRLLIQGGLFLGLGAIVALSTAVFLHFRSAAISLEKEVRNLARDKSSIIDAELTKRISVVSGLSFLRYARVDLELANRMPAILQSLLAVPGLAEDKFEEMKDWQLPRDFVAKGWSITDKDKEYVLEILAIWYYLQEKVPEACSKLVRRITDGTIAAILLAILIGVIDIILQYHFESILSLLGLSIVVAGYYCICGILGVKKMTKLEELSKKLEKTENVDRVREISMEITRL